MSPSVVLLHGASGNANTWLPLLPHWAELQPLVLDLPGRGSAPGAACSSVAALAEELMSRLPSAPVVLVGHSLGGAVALQAALDHPERVAALVMVSSSARLGVAPPILQAVAEATAEQPFRLDLAFGPSTSRATINTYATHSATIPPATSVADWTACNGFDVRSRLPEVQCPVLVLHGSADFLTPPKHQVSLASALPNAHRVALEDAGHMLPWEAPKAVADAVTHWVTSLG